MDKKQCYICGENAVSWEADFDADQIEPDLSGIYHDFICRKCGARIRVFELIEKQQHERRI